jgi:hypothetical protein
MGHALFLMRMASGTVLCKGKGKRQNDGTNIDEAGLAQLHFGDLAKSAHRPEAGSANADAPEANGAAVAARLHFGARMAGQTLARHSRSRGRRRRRSGSGGEVGEEQTLQRRHRRRNNGLRGHGHGRGRRRRRRRCGHQQTGGTAIKQAVVNSEVKQEKKVLIL